MLLPLPLSVAVCLLGFQYPFESKKYVKYGLNLVTDWATSNTFPFFPPQKLLCVLYVFVVLLHDELLSNEFGGISLYISAAILLLPSQVTSPMKTTEPVPGAAIHAQAITLPLLCLTDEVVC